MHVCACTNDMRIYSLNTGQHVRHDKKYVRMWALYARENVDNNKAFTGKKTEEQRNTHAPMCPSIADDT